MLRKVFETRLKAPPERVWEFYRSAEALKILTPPAWRFELVGGDPEVREGAVQEARFRMFGVPLRWTARIHDVRPPFGFADTAMRSPFFFWNHQHEFLPDGEGTRLRDVVRYVPPAGPFGGILNWLFIERQIERLFAYRYEATRKALGED